MSMHNRKIEIKGCEINRMFFAKEDFISPTDIAKPKNSAATGLVISHWLSTRYTMEFMGLWEKIHNPIFNVSEFGNIKNQSGLNSFILSSKNWINCTNAIGIVSKTGRYGGKPERIIYQFVQHVRLARLNQVVISQMRLRLDDKSVTQLLDSEQTDPTRKLR